MSLYRTYRYLLQPTSRQRSGLTRLCLGQCELYNAALEERRGAWAWEHRSVSYVDQCRTLTETREVRPDLFDCGLTVCRGTLMRLEWAFAAFYRRCRNGDTPGYPRFKAASRFDSVQWEDTSGWGLDTENKRLRLFGIGSVKLRMHRQLRGTPKAITVSRQGQRWWVSIRCAEVPAQPLPATGQSVGIDLGVCALVATSEGELVSEGRFAQKAKDRLAGAQRALATKQRGSMHRRRACEAVGRAHRKVANQRKDLAHRLSRRLVNDHDLIVVEALRGPQMSRRPKPRPNGKGGFDPNGARAKAGLNRSIADAGWGMLRSMLVYKAEDAGRELIAVDPRHTSTRCASCGHTESGNRVSQAVFRCRGCGHKDHADVNAARNILRAGRAQRASARAGSGN
jgi:putative transposase